MKKQHRKNNFFNLILILTLVLSTFVLSRVESTAASATASTNAHMSKSEIKTDNIPAGSKIFAQQKVEPSKQTVKKESLPLKKEASSESKKSISRFFLAMIGVLLSSLAIFGGLKAYNHFASNKHSAFDNKKSKSSLESPKNFKESINSFLEKTDK